MKNTFRPFAPAAALSDATNGTPRAKRFTLNTADAKSSATILTLLAQENGWAEVTTRGNVQWVVSPEALETSLATRKGEERVSHIPGMHGLCRKAPFALLAQHCGWDFFPETWIVRPGETASRSLTAALRAGALILKPDDGTQGDGIFLVRSLPDLQRHLARVKDGPVILQKYIRDPMLLGDASSGQGRKFDLRQWVLVTSIHPLTVWFYEGSYLRFAGSP